MSFYDNLLKDLHTAENGADELTPSVKMKIKDLKHRAMYILPFWNSRIRLSRDKETKLYQEKSGALEDLDSFADGMLEFSKNTMDDADVFYGSNAHEESSFNWYVCTELSLKNLEYAQNLDSLSVAVKEKVKAAEDGVRLITSYCKLMLKWNFEKLMEEAKLHPKPTINRGCIYIPSAIFKQCTRNLEENGEVKKLDLFLWLTEHYKTEAKKGYCSILQALSLTRPYACLVNNETLCCFTDNLKQVLTTLINNLPPSKHSDERQLLGDMISELIFIKSCTTECSVKGTSDAICTHMDVLAAEAIDFLSVTCSSSDEVTKSILSAKEDISCIRNEVRYLKRNETIRADSSVDAFTDYLKVSNDYSSIMTLAEDHPLRLELLHSSTRDLEKLLRLIPELEIACQQNEHKFWKAWWDVRSDCFRTIRSKSKYASVCFSFLQEFVVQMPSARKLCLDLVRFQVTMIKSDHLLVDLYNFLTKKPVPNKPLLDLLIFLLINVNGPLDSSACMVLVPGKSHAAFSHWEPLIQSLILMEPFDQCFAENDVVDLHRDIKHGIVHLIENRQFSLAEKVESLEALVRKFYRMACWKLLTPSRQLPLSELAYLDVQDNLIELKKLVADSAEFTEKIVATLNDVLPTCISLFRDDERDELKHLSAQTIKVVQKVEYVISISEEVPNWFFQMLLFDIADEVKQLKEEITKNHFPVVCETDAGGSVGKAKKQKLKYGDTVLNGSSTHDQTLFGFEADEENLKEQLRRDPKQQKIISIVGMPGLGKTTLARKVYDDCAQFFHAHAWCYVSQEYQRKELISNILSQIDGSINHKGVPNEEDLANSLHKSLSEKKNYLIVLDDIWDFQAWNALKDCFRGGANGSRLLLTSRSQRIGNIYTLQLLTAEKSWDMLKNKIFGAGICPRQLRAVGMEIAGKCGGLPLSLAVIAGVLKNTSKTQDEWKQVARKLESGLVVNQEEVSSKLELSYSHLPVEAKRCFLYGGAYMKGKEIPKSKLFRLWVAERFVEEATTEHFLSELVDRSLLIVTKRGISNRIQSCRIHDLLRDFCIQKALDENFIVTLDRSSNELGNFRRRLCFNFSGEETEDDFETFFPPSRRVRSMMLLTNVFGNYIFFHADFIFEDFKSLNTLDLENVQLADNIPESVGGLTSLRYLAVRGVMSRIPTSIGQVLCLETLIVRGTRGEVYIPDDIFKLTKLKHLLVNRRAGVYAEADDNINHTTLPGMRTFTTPILCQRTAEKIISNMPNLCKLKCIFLKRTDVYGKSIVFPALDYLSKLESLKVSYEGSKICSQTYKLSFPANLKKLSLSKFRLPWSKMEQISASLPQLEVLKLLLNAFQGHCWDTTKKGKNSPAITFPRLKYLILDDLDIVKWEASEEDFPELKKLVIRRCKKLESIPFSFSEVDDLQSIEVHTSSQSVIQSVLDIQKTQRNNGNTQLQTLIHPPEFGLVLKS